MAVEDMMEVHDPQVEVLEDPAERADFVELQLEVGDHTFELIAPLQDGSRQVGEPRTLRIVAQPLELRGPRDHVPAERDQLLKDQRQLRDQKVEVVDRHRRSTVYNRPPTVRKFVGLRLAILLVSLSACTLDPPRKVTLAEGLPRTENVVELEGVAVDRFDRDQLATRAEMRRAKVDRAEGTIAGEEVGILAYDETKALAARVEAPRGVAKRGTATLEGGVSLRDREGRVLRSERMIYDADRGTVTAPGEVTIEGENFVARGTSLIYTQKDSLIEVTGPLSATITPDQRALSRGSK